MLDLERLLQLDELLRSQPRPTAQSLAEVLECNEKTVRRYLEYLRDRFDAPIEHNRKQGWHYSNPDWRLSSVALTRGEIFALTLGARMLTAYGGSAYGSELQSAIEQLVKRLPEQSWVDLHELADEHVMFRSGAELDLDPEVWQTLEQACRQRQQVWMRYGTPGKPVSERRLDPYLLHFSRNNPYITGWCHKRNAARWFRVDRIQEIKLLEENFEVHPSFDRETHVMSAFQHEVGGTPQHVAIWFDGPTAPYIRERKWHPSQRIDEHPDGALTLRLVVRGLNEVKRWVLFYGQGAKVLGPPELVGMVRDEVQGMNLHYG
ncbi:helix-turn-helix transcriptional regulator [Leptothoe sp. PORK10 BA2]|uniref:helix-turn-helix transcriptional regulator n=1 Tax=Leptothoe sp. PORK10 BA2 TaxID=3110254 RepID=UPI002B21D3F0|nr:transcriptional regulator [Leptothoe sp. PORK10 BA2]MEA5463885.1 transcriptional regulator [Leptothoe sp. PORK10 BA2]